MSTWWARQGFVSLWVSRLLAYLGDQMVGICMTVRVFRMLGTGAALGTFYVVRVLPSALLGPVIGVFIDASDRRILAAAGLGLSSVFAVALYYSGTVTPVLVFSFFAAVASTVFGHSLRSLLPEVIEKDRLLNANSIQSGTESAARLVAPAVSAALLAIAGTSGALLAAACSYVLAAVAALTIGGRPRRGETGATASVFVQPATSPGPRRGSSPAREFGLAAKATGRHLVEGLHYLVGQRTLLLVTLVVTLVMFADSSVSPLFTILLDKHLKVPPEFIGYLSSGYGAGLLIGAVAGPWLAKRVGEPGLVPAGALLIGIQMLVYSSISVFWAALPLQLVCGAGFALLMNGAITAYQMVVPGRLIGRAISSSAAMGSMATVFAAKAGGAVADWKGVRAVFFGAGLVSLFATACSLRLARERPGEVEGPGLISP